MAAGLVSVARKGPAFHVLGPLKPSGPRGITRIRPGRQEATTAMPVCQADRTVRLSKPVDRIWDEEPPRTARVQARTCVLRGGLSPASSQSTREPAQTGQ
jgi:hypothetical protein